MRSFHLPVWLFALCVCCLPVSPAVSEDKVMVSTGTPALVSRATLEARLKEVEAAASLDEETRATLVETLNKTLGNLETIKTNKAATESYVQARKTAPEQTSAIREKLDAERESDAEVSVTATADSPFDVIEGELLQEKANLVAVQAKLADLEAQLETGSNRPVEVQKQLTQAKQDKDDIEAKLKLEAPADQLPWLTEARLWSRTTRAAELRNEIGMLDQELLSMPMRTNLLEAQRDQASRTVKRVDARVKILEKLSSRQGHVEAVQAREAAAEAVSDAVGKHAIVQELAEENAELTRELGTIAASLRMVSASDDSIEKEAGRIEDYFRTARERLAIAGLSEVLGEVLREQRQTLPDTRKLRKKISSIESDNAHAALRQVQHSQEYKGLRDLDDFIEARTADLDAAEVALVSEDLRELAESRRSLLDKALNLDKSYSRSQAELAASYQRLLKISQDFDAFLAENLLWIRSAPMPNLATLKAIPGQIGLLFSPSRWLEVSETLLARVAQSPFSIFMLAVFGLLLWKARHLRVLLKAMGMQVGKPSLDRFSYTLKALGLTLLLAAPWPLLVWIMGWELGAAADVQQFPRLVSRALLTVAPAFFYVQFFSVMCVPDGIAAKHFRWPHPVPERLHREFAFLKVTFLPALFVVVLVVYDEQKAFHGGLERLIMIVALAVLAVFFYRVMNLLIAQSIGSMTRLRYLWLVLTVVTPLSLAMLAFFGYFYTAGTLGSGLVQTLWFVFGLVVFHQVVVRWLLLVQRRLALQAVRERMRAAREEKAPVDSEMAGMPVAEDEPEIDLVAMSEESRKLLNTVLVIIGIIGFWLIWSDVLPAFNILDEVTLWHHTVVVAGEKTMVPATLADVGLAILIAIATLVAMKRFPALLEILLLQRVRMTAGSRYTITTLTTYAIVGVGLIAFFNVIGADWSKVQWLFAALSVGIGFGLQEIVANFISGIIILFERPIRVGDVVTIGATDGVVTRIQIRATTIRTWDRQELLVPNKEFITGRLLNWSLSDQTTRIKVPVGVAYGSDVQKAMSLMDAAARDNEHVLTEPNPSIIFEAFGDNSLNLVLRCFVGAQDVRMTTITQLHEAINEKFNDAGISISFPQRDVHLDTLKPLDVRISRDAGSTSS
ncbi:MAG TPA: mechanosensitive ion channel protein MscS [Gammaproteobacteria bacterium]|nr:mechanosensitive ion channel protein MscS [Gammaproteobacteria bacterium]